MDIASISPFLSQSSLALKVGVAVTKLAMDTATQRSQSMVNLMERSVNPNVGGNIDIKV